MEPNEQQLEELVKKLMKIQRHFGYEQRGVVTSRQKDVRECLEAFIKEVAEGENSQDNS